MNPTTTTPQPTHPTPDTPPGTWVMPDITTLPENMLPNRYGRIATHNGLSLTVCWELTWDGDTTKAPPRQHRNWSTEHYHQLVIAEDAARRMDLDQFRHLPDLVEFRFVPFGQAFAHFDGPNSSPNYKRIGENQLLTPAGPAGPTVQTRHAGIGPHTRVQLFAVNPNWASEWSTEPPATLTHGPDQEPEPHSASPGGVRDAQAGDREIEGLVTTESHFSENDPRPPCGDTNSEPQATQRLDSDKLLRLYHEADDKRSALRQQLTDLLQENRVISEKCERASEEARASSRMAAYWFDHYRATSQLYDALRSRYANCIEALRVIAQEASEAVTENTGPVSPPDPTRPFATESPIAKGDTLTDDGGRAFVVTSCSAETVEAREIGWNCSVSIPLPTASKYRRQAGGSQ